MQHIPFAPWMRGNRALDLVRNADGPRRSVAPLTYYSAVLTVHEQLSGEVWSAEAWVNVARTKLMEGDLQAAEAALSQAGMMGTPDAEAPMMLAEILLHTDRAERAHGLLKHVVDQRPRIARAHYLLGVACRDLGLGDEEADAYRAAVEIDPDFTQAWFRLGNHMSLRRQLDPAIEAWRETLRVDPNHEGALCNLGQALHRSGDATAAAECLARLRELDPDMAAFLELGMAVRKRIPAGVRLRQYPRPSTKKGKGDS